MWKSYVGIFFFLLDYFLLDVYAGRDIDRFGMRWDMV